MRYSIITIAALLSVPFSAHAGWFDWLDDPLGLNEAAKNAGAKAGAEAAEGMVKASRNITMTTNQFGQILSDYYGDNAQNKENARKLIEGAFGVDLKQTGKFEVEVTAAFENTNTTKPLRSDIFFVNDESDSQVQGLLKTSTIFKGEEINAPTLTSTTIDEARTQIRKLIDNRANYAGCPKPNIMTGGTIGGGQIRIVTNQPAIDKCEKDYENSAFADAILTPIIFTKTIPLKASFSRQYTGGKYAVLVIPSEDLQSAPSDLRINIIMHQQGDTTKTLSVFKSSPQRVDINYMKQHIAKTDNTTYGAFNYFFVDLRIEGVAAAPLSSK